jgi:serine/threonine protein kinase/tetratricopeptide (TPR) repeat protein
VLPPDEPKPDLDGRFRLEGERIAGGMGTVYRAVDLSTGETVAVKISSSFGSQLGERFQQEANCLAGIAHPAIVRYIAHGKTAHGEHYLVMEWLDGETLEDRLARGPISMGTSVQMIRRVGEALSAAHQHGVIHRDIKPANIFLPGKDVSKIKLLDFGIARRLFDPASLRLTQAGSALGTPMYMSPEQAQGSLDVDARADVFALGCVFFECLTGSPPFMGESTTATLAKVAADDSIDVEAKCPGIPESLTGLLRRMLAKRASERPSSMAEVVDELSTVTGELRLTGVYPVVKRQRFAAADASLLVATGERRLVSIIVVSPRSSSPPPPAQPDPRTTTVDLGNILARDLSDAEFDDSRLDAVSRDIAPFGARIQRLANGSLVVTLAGDVQNTPLDLAVRAARCALKLKSARRGSSLGISLGHAIKENELRTSDLVDSAARLVSDQHIGSIHVNSEIKRLLEARFEIVSEPDGRARLLFEKGLRDAPRTVLGKEIPCLGRDREVRNLEGFFEECVDEPAAQVVIVSGSAGCGKSRVAHEFLERVRDAGHAVELLIGRGDPMRANVSLGLVGQALRGAAGIGGTEPDEVQRKRLLAHASRFLPPKSAATTVAFLGEITNIRFPDDDLPQLRAARRDARLMADQTMGAWVDWLEAEAGHHSVLLFFEDLHWGDFASVNYVDQALRVLRGRPLMVLALARPEVDERFYGLWRERHVQRISLPPMTNRASQEMIRRILGDVAPEKMAWLVDHAQGNPFYLEELARAVALGEDIAAIPDTVLGMVQVRFDAVGEGSRLVLRAASIFGQSFTAAGVKALVDDMDGDDVDRWLEILVDKEILFSRPTGNTRQHVFRHALLYQAAYAMLSPKDEVGGHCLAGLFLEEAGERDAIVLADHFEKGNQPERAVRWLRVAANQAMEVDDLNSALERVERGVRLGARGEDLAELRVVEAEARYWKGEYAEAECAAREARQCKDPKLSLRAISALIQALGPQAKYDEIGSINKELESRPQQPELLNAWLECRYNAAAYIASSGQYEARERILQLLEAERASLEPMLVGRVESMKAHLARAEDRPVDQADGFRRAWEFFESAGHRRAATEALANAGNALMEIGRLEEAEVQIRSLLAIAERMGLDHLLGPGFYMLSNILAYRGCLDEARSFGERAVEWTTKNNDQYFGSAAQLYLSVIEHLAGAYPTAERHARRALEMVENNPSYRPFALALIARSLGGQKQTTEALSYAREAYAQLERDGQVQDGEMIIRLTFAECLAATSDLATAKQVVAKARDRLEKQADNIHTREWRQSFLTQIPEHRRILELARELGIVDLEELSNQVS